MGAQAQEFGLRSEREKQQRIEAGDLLGNGKVHL